MGTTHHVNIAPPVSKRSVKFMAISIPIMDIKDMPRAVFSEEKKSICFNKIVVSRTIEVIKPFIIAKPITSKLFQL